MGLEVRKNVSSSGGQEVLPCSVHDGRGGSTSGFKKTLGPIGRTQEGAGLL